MRFSREHAEQRPAYVVKNRKIDEPLIYLITFFQLILLIAVFRYD